jgi:hypothetical protein
MRVVVLGRLDERVDVEVGRGVARAVNDLPAPLADDLDEVRAVAHASFAYASRRLVRLSTSAVEWVGR